MITTTQRLALVGTLDPSPAWNGRRLLHPDTWEPGAPVPDTFRGAAASFRADAAGRCRFVRDPLGLNKLFWSAVPDGDVLVATRPARLVDAGRPFASIRAVPPGVFVDLDPATDSVVVRRPCHGPTRPCEPRPLEDLATDIRRGLERYLAAIAAAYPDARAFVCASGGLDSSGVAALAREQFRDVVAVSFDIRRCGRPGSEDRRTTQRLARELDLLYLDATVTAEELLELLDTVLVEAVDWRDFNVHAGLVNAALARVIAAVARDRPALVLTGDLANELLADYRAEEYRGRTYYRLPRVPRPALRDVLVRGLDTSNREVGPFAAWGLTVVQPYAAVADHYLALSNGFLCNPRRKADLGRLVFGSRIPDYVYARPKARAQVGGSEMDGGVLALCLDRGLDQRALRDRFARLHGLDPDTDGRLLDRFIRSGRYRAAIPGSSEEPS